MYKVNGDEWNPLQYDKDGVVWDVDAFGRRRVPEYADIISKPGEFTQYDTSRGHCGLCGSLYCRGTCFK